MDTLTITPVAGIKPGSRPRFSRGYLMDGKAHAVRAADVKGGELVTTVCGRTIMATTVYQSDAWPKVEPTACARCREQL